MQNTNAIIMIRPACFGWNAETAKSNHFQQVSLLSADDVHANSLLEFDLACSLLRQKKLKVTVFQDKAENETPDSIFPNNWFSTHSSGKVVLYPMMAPNRRKERITEFDQILREEGFEVLNVLDFSSEEENGKFLEGTGSLVLDRTNKVAYAAISPRTDASLVHEWAGAMGYSAVTFPAWDNRTEPPTAIYHTNVIMSIGQDLAVICEEALGIEDATILKDQLQASGREVISISLEQMDCFAGNVLELINEEGQKLWVMSATAERSFTQEQISLFEEKGQIVALQIPTIEQIGGGSARCMIAENFLASV